MTGLGGVSWPSSPVAESAAPIIESAGPDGADGITFPCPLPSLPETFDSAGVVGPVSS